MNRDPMIIQLRTGGEQSVHPRKGYFVYALGAALALVLILVAFISYGWFVSQGQEAAGEADVEEIVSNVGLLMLLPSDEQPTVATVTNLNSLKDQPFFKHAKIGDIVLMYPISKRAILYSPTENMIIEVAPIVTP